MTASATWSLGRHLAENAWRFTVVSLAGFSPWAFAGGWFHARVGEVGLYVACLVAFLLAAVLFLPWTLPGPRRFPRFLVFFVPAFVTYAVVWCGCWFALGSRLGEWLGAGLGGAAFVLLTTWRLGWPSSLLLTVAVFVLVHASGYFAGGKVMHLLAGSGRPGIAGMLAWGVCYGLGFGAGLGYVVHACTSAPDQPAGT